MTDEAFRFALLLDGSHDVECRDKVGEVVTCHYGDGVKVRARLAKREVVGKFAWYMCEGEVVVEGGTLEWRKRARQVMKEAKARGWVVEDSQA